MQEYEILLLQKRRGADEADAQAIERFVASIENHAQKEAAFLQEYGKAIDAHDSPLVRFLLELILSDEEKHHLLLETVVGRLKADLGYAGGSKGAPSLEAIGQANVAEMRQLTDRFIDEERDGIQKTKKLMKDVQGCYDGLLVLILQMLVKDSEKHIMMLQFLRTRLR